MIHTRTNLGALVFGLCCVFACAQKDPNDGLNTDDADDTDTTQDTSEETSEDPSDDTTTGETSSADTTTDVATTSGATSDDTNASDTDTTEATEADASADSTDSDVTSTDTTSDTTNEPSDEICPMMAGATWSYQHTGWREDQTVTAIEYEGEAAFLVKDTPDPEDNLRADTILVKRDGRLLRVYKEEFWVNPNTDAETLETKATYGVGFVRCDEAWATKDVGWMETPEYIRVETVGEDPAKAPEERSHTYTVEGREDVSTSNGKSYNNCVKVRRSKDWAAVESAEDATEKLYWFCPGVGKVREENVESGNFEELLEYSIP